MADVVGQKAEGFADFIVHGEWWKTLKEVAWAQIWPWPGVWKELKAIGSEAAGAAREIWASFKGGAQTHTFEEYLKLQATQLDKGLDHILAIWKSLNNIIGQLGLWIFAGAVGIGALFFGVGAAAGAAFAEEVGVAALVSAGAEMALEAAKAVIDLQVHDATLTEKEKHALYEKIADASIFLGIAAVMFFVGPIAEGIAGKEV